MAITEDNGWASRRLHALFLLLARVATAENEGFLLKYWDDMHRSCTGMQRILCDCSRQTCARPPGSR